MSVSFFLLSRLIRYKIEVLELSDMKETFSIL